MRVRVEAGARTDEFVEWVAPRSGHCRSEGERVEISTDRLRAIVAPPAWGPVAGAVVRAGSPRFVHGLGAERCAGLVALRARPGGGEARWRGRAVVATVEETIGAEQAVQRKLFSIDGEPLRGYDVERAPAEPPAAPIAVYWLAPSHGRLAALQAIEHFDRYRGQEPTRVHTVFYGRPPIRAGAPQIQVTSMPLGDALARRTLDELERHVRVHDWPRYEVELASGERARVYPNLGEGTPVVGFSVVTEETLVGVAPARPLSLPEVRELSAGLRPLTAGRP